MTQTKMVPLDKIRDNPWRDRVRNPIDADRVESIAISIGKTKYWMGTYGRELPDGTVQLAFGHHRLEAAKEQSLKEIPIILEDFTDGEMLVWMAQENVRGEIPVVKEAVFAAVKALAEGKIKVDAIDVNTPTAHLRYAPSFITGNGRSPTVGERTYTVDSIARFLGYVKKSTNRAKNSVVAAIGILEQAEKAGAEGGDVGKKKAEAIEQSFSKLPVNEAVKAISETKHREEVSRVAEGKRAEEINKYNAKQKELEDLRKKHEETARLEREALIQKQLKAKADEDEKEIKRLAQKMREQAANVKLKQIADSEKLQAVEAKIAAAKLKAEEAKKKDAYAPVRRDVERLLFRMDNVSTGSFCADIKAIAKLPLTVKDRQRIWESAQALGNWYLGWVSAQVSVPILTGKKELKEMKARELANRRKSSSQGCC
jgi:hypothetical protein